MGEGLSARSSLSRTFPDNPFQLAGSRLLTADPGFRQLLAQVPRLAVTDLPVLITGEPGTGKELVAEALWAHSLRHKRPLHRLNCALLGGELATSELFGHLKGAFTGAQHHRLGKFQLAHRGTLFLDEVGELDPTIQPRLLRVLEQGEVEPLGSDVSTRVDVRLICATNQDLGRLVDAGRFRRDLFDRLAVLLLHLPPLRARGDDVLLLADHFAEQEARRFQRPVVGFSAAARRRLQDYPWPGNVRELRNVITRAVLFCQGHLIQAKDLLFAPSPGSSKGDLRAPAPSWPARPDREALKALLRATGGNISAAARRLRVCTRTVYRWLKALDLEVAEFRKTILSEGIRSCGNNHSSPGH